MIIAITIAQLYVRILGESIGSSCVAVVTVAVAVVVALCLFLL
jgi:hypothetical protein